MRSMNYTIKKPKNEAVKNYDVAFMILSDPEKSGRTDAIKSEWADAMNKASSHKVIVMFIYMCYSSIFIIGISMPLLSFSDGMFRPNHYIYFISDGFIKHSAIASLIYGVGSMIIGVIRLWGIIFYIESPIRSMIYVFVLIATILGGIATTRYDEIQNLHVIAAVVWISSSLVFHGVILAFNQKYAVFHKIHPAMFVRVVWVLTVLFSLGLISCIISFQSVESYTVWNLTGLFEYLTAEMILVLDFCLAFSIHHRFCKFT